jgi:hypothetical protein
MTDWIPVTASMPPEEATVWLTDGTHAWLGCRVWTEGQWWWATLAGQVYAQDGQIIAECEIEDIEPTHWHALPTLPTDNSTLFS